jgi:hypothetical protein
LSCAVEAAWHRPLDGSQKPLTQLALLLGPLAAYRSLTRLGAVHPPNFMTAALTDRLAEAVADEVMQRIQAIFEA